MTAKRRTEEQGVGNPRSFKSTNLVGSFQDDGQKKAVAQKNRDVEMP